MHYTSKLIENAVEEIAKLPGIGRKTALRLTLHLLNQDEIHTTKLTDTLVTLRRDIRYCVKCHAIADTEVCGICADKKRDNELLCIVERTQDLMAIEHTAQFRGYYHVLGGLIDPLHGSGPDDLCVSNLLERVTTLGTKEIIMALSPTIPGDTTAYYIGKLLEQTNVKISVISRGISVGSELDYVDEITLGKSILARTQLR